jgi:hypothetical protein
MIEFETLQLDIIFDKQIKTEDILKHDCTFLQYGDRKFPQKAWICLTCGEGDNIFYICEKCLKTCHSNCNTELSKQNRPIRNTQKQDYVPFVCNCALKNFFKQTHERAIKDEQIEQLNYHKDLNEYFFDSEFLANFETLLCDIENDNTPTIAIETSTQFMNLLEEHLKTYKYLSEMMLVEIEKLFPYERLRNILLNKKQSLLEQDTLLLILYYTQIKRDYKDVQVVSFDSYISKTFEERLMYKEYLELKLPEAAKTKYSIYTSNKVNNPTSLSNFLIIFSNRLKKLLLMETNNALYETFFKIIKFGLKNFLFNLDEIQTLIKIIFKDFMDKVSKYILNSDPYSFITVLYLITISYNDLVIMNEYQNKETSNFIHKSGTFGEMMVKMILQMKEIIQHIFDAECLSDYNNKMFIMLEDLTKLYLVEDNQYLICLEKSNPLNVRLLLSQNKKHKNRDQIINRELKCLFIDFKISLERRNSTDQNYREIIENFFAGLNKRTTGDSEKHNLNDSNILIKLVHKSFKKVNVMNSVFKSDSFINDISNITKTIAEENVIDAIYNSLFYETTFKQRLTEKIESHSDYQDISNIFNFLSIMCLTKEGLTSILSDNALTRILNLFENANFKYLIDFQLLLFYSCHFYKFKVFKKQLCHELVNKIINYLKNSVIVNNDYTEMNKLMQVLYYMSAQLDHEEFKQIKAAIVTILKDKNILVKENIVNAFKEIDQGGTNCSPNKTFKTHSVKESRTSYDINMFSDDKDNVPLKEDDKLTINKFGSRKIFESETETDGTLISSNAAVFVQLIKLFSKNLCYVNKYESFYNIIEQMQQLFAFDYLENIIATNPLSARTKKNLMKFLASLYLFRPIDGYRKAVLPSFNDGSKGSQCEIEFEINYILPILNILKSEFGKIYQSEHSAKKFRSYTKLLLTVFKSLSNILWFDEVMYRYKPASVSLLAHIKITYYQFCEDFMPKIPYFSSILQKSQSDTIHENLVERSILDEFAQLKSPLDLDKLYSLLSRMFCYFDYFITAKYNYQDKLKDLDKFYYNKFYSKSNLALEEYSSLYAANNNTDTSKDYDPLFENVIKRYNNEMYFYETSFNNVLSEISMKESKDYNCMILNYIISYYMGVVHINDDFEVSLLIILTKLFYYNTSKFQATLEKMLKRRESKLEEKSDDKDFLIEFYLKLNNQLLLCYNTVVNNFIDEYHSYNTILQTSLMIKFIQSLGEGFCKIFLDSVIIPRPLPTFERYYKQIFSKLSYKCRYIEEEIVIPTTDGNFDPSHTSMYLNIFSEFDFLYFFLRSSCEIPHHRSKNLIVIFKSELEFLIEYCDTYWGTCSDNEQFRFNKVSKRLIEYTNFLTNTEQLNRMQESQQNTQFYLFISNCILRFLIATLQQNESEYIFNDVTASFDIFDIYSFLLIFLKNMLKVNYKHINLLQKDLLNDIMVLYTKHAEFQRSQEFQLCRLFYKYAFLINENFNSDILLNYYKNNTIFFSEGLDTNKDIYSSYFGASVYAFLTKISSTVEVTINNQDKIENMKMTFFKPSNCYFLYKQTKKSFLDDVDRSSRVSKLNNLIRFTDYVIFETFYNHSLSKYNLFVKLFKEMKLYYFEVINYMFIIIHQIMLFYNFYREDPPTGSQDYFTESDKNHYINSNNWLVIAHGIYLIFVLSICLLFYHNQNTVFNIMKQNDVKLLAKIDESRYQYPRFIEISKNHRTLRQYIYSQISLFQRLKVFIVDSLLMNRNLNTFVLTSLCLIIYCTTGHAIALVIPVIFMSNLSDLLRNIVLAMQLKWAQLLLVILFTYVIVYIFSWVSFFYLYKIYTVEAFSESETNLVNYNLCGTAIECWLNSIDYGVRSTGGIGDHLPVIAFHGNENYFFKMFFFNMLFQIFVVLIMGNIFLGFIIDTFVVLRNQKMEFEKDSLNVCFICSLNRNNNHHCDSIDFQYHISEEHHIWSYVYFIIYLHTNNSKNFNQYENQVYEKLMRNEISWIPLFADS